VRLRFFRRCPIKGRDKKDDEERGGGGVSSYLTPLERGKDAEGKGGGKVG